MSYNQKERAHVKLSDEIVADIKEKHESESHLPKADPSKLRKWTLKNLQQYILDVYGVKVGTTAIHYAVSGTHWIDRLPANSYIDIEAEKLQKEKQIKELIIRTQKDVPFDF